MTAPIPDPVDRRWICLPVLIALTWAVPITVVVRLLRR